MKRDIPDINDLAGRKGLSLRQAMDFTTTVNPLGPSAKAKNAIRKGIKVLCHHPDRQARRLAAIIARTEGVPEENILACGSLKGLLAGILSAFEVRRVLFSAPYPSYHREFLQSCPCETGFSPLDRGNGFTIETNRWTEDMARFDAAVISSPSFVSKEAPSREDMTGIMGLARSGGTLLIIDETLREYSGQASFAREALDSDGWLIVRSLTEYYALAGIPVAYAIGGARMIERIKRAAPMSALNTLAAEAAAAALKDKTYPRRTQAFMKKEHPFIEQGLGRIDGVSFFMGCCGFYVVSLERPPSKPMETFLRYGILIDELLPAPDRSIFFPVKDHKWNARYLKTLKNIMGAK